MRPLTVVALLALGSSAAAQAPVTPSAPPVPPAGRAFEVRLGGVMIAGERNSEYFDNFASGSGLVRGAEGLLRGKAGGLSFRTLSSDFGEQPQVTSADLRLLIGPPVFTVAVGGSRRVLWSSLGSNSFDFGLAGVSTTLAIGGTGLRANAGGVMYFPRPTTEETMKGGMEGETSLIYTLPRLPLYVQVGYRTELFTAVSGTKESPEELRGIRVGGGLQLGGR